MYKASGHLVLPLDEVKCFPAKMEVWGLNSDGKEGAIDATIVPRQNVKCRQCVAMTAG
jgi:hypothetical protein